MTRPHPAGDLPHMGAESAAVTAEAAVDFHILPGRARITPKVTDGEPEEGKS